VGIPLELFFIGAIGRPHFGHAGAPVETSELQSGHLMRAIVLASLNILIARALVHVARNPIAKCRGTAAKRTAAPRDVCWCPAALR